MKENSLSKNQSTQTRHHCWEASRCALVPKPETEEVSRAVKKSPMLHRRVRLSTATSASVCLSGEMSRPIYHLVLAFWVLSLETNKNQLVLYSTLAGSGLAAHDQIHLIQIHSRNRTLLSLRIMRQRHEPYVHLDQVSLHTSKEKPHFSVF